MALGQKDPHIVRFEASLDASEIEKSKVVEKIRKGPSCKDFGTSVVHGRDSSQQGAR